MPSTSETLLASVLHKDPPDDRSLALANQSTPAKTTTPKRGMAVAPLRNATR